MVVSSDPSDLWLTIYKKFPELFQIIKEQKKTILKIIPALFKEKFDQVKTYLKDKRLEAEIPSLIPSLNASEIKKYILLKNINDDKKHELVKKYLRPDYWPIFLLGQEAILEKENGNMDEVMKIKREARDRIGITGITLINFILQNYFNELIIPLLIYQTKQLKSDSEVFGWFNGFLDKIIKFFPRAFWVSNSTSKIEIRRKLIQRCVTYGFKDINVHTIGKNNIKKIKDVLMELSSDEEFPKFDYNLKYEIEELNALTINIKVI